MYITHGIEIGTDTDNHYGVFKNFSIFDGATFLSKIKEYFESDSEEIPFCNEGTVDGYMSGLVVESGVRLFRILPYRKTQVGTNNPAEMFED